MEASVEVVSVEVASVEAFMGDFVEVASVKAFMEASVKLSWKLPCKLLP